MAQVARKWGFTVKSEIHNEHTAYESRTYKAYITDKEEEELYDSVCP